MKATLLRHLCAALLLLPQAGPAAESKLRVLTSFLPMQAHAQAVAGTAAQVEQLLSKDAGPHDYQLTAGDVKKLAAADLFIINGAGLEQWLDELVNKAGAKKLVLVDTSKGVRLQANPTSFDATTASGMNPHLWLDPVLAQHQTMVILAALKKADPANAATFQTNADAYLAKLAALDNEFRVVLAPLPNKSLVTFHDAFPYLATRYELNYVGCLSEFPEKDPTPKQLAGLVDRMHQHHVSVIFAETGYAPSLLQEIARQTGAAVSELDTLEIGVGDAAAYLTRMKKNLEVLKAAFQ